MTVEKVEGDIYAAFTYRIFVHGGSENISGNLFQKKFAEKEYRIEIACISRRVIGIYRLNSHPVRQ